MMYFRSFQSKREISPQSVCEGAGQFTHVAATSMQHTHTEEMAEKTRSKVWLNINRLDLDNACAKSAIRV